MSEEQAEYNATPKQKLTTRQRLFVDAYLQCWNAAESARRAGYSEKAARQTGRFLLTNPYIKAEVEQRLLENQMQADEALARLADMARGDIGDLIDNNGLLDIRQARAKGLTKLLKKIKQKTVTRIGKSDDDDDVEITEIEFEMYDAQAALDKVLRAHGKYKDTVEHDGKIELVVRYADTDNDTKTA